VKIQLPDPAVEPTMTVPHASKVVGISVRAGYDAVARGEWPTIHIGRSVRVLTLKFLRQYGLDDDRDPSRLRRGGHTDIVGLPAREAIPDA